MSMNAKRMPLVWLLLVLVTGMSLVFANPDPPVGGDPAAGEVETVTRSLFKENYEKAYKEMMTYYEKNNPKIAEALKSKKLSDAFVKKHAGNSDLKTVVLDLLKPELTSGKLKLAEFEKMPFKAYTAFDRGSSFSTVPKTNQPTTTNAFNPKVRTGYSADITSIDPNAPHTFGNVEAYANDRFTKTALDRMKNSGNHIEIHAGSDAETFQSLKNRGYEVRGTNECTWP